MAKDITSQELDLGLLVLGLLDPGLLDLGLLDLGLLDLGLVVLGLLGLGLLYFYPMSRCRRVWCRLWRCRSHCPYLAAWPLLHAHSHQCTVSGSSSSSRQHAPDQPARRHVCFSRVIAFLPPGRQAQPSPPPAMNLGCTCGMR